MTALQRRTVLKAAALASGVAAINPSFAVSALGGLTGTAGASRQSRLDRTKSLHLVHTDLHNHSIMGGDADGEPHDALRQLRKAGLDVACMTEHAVAGKGWAQDVCGHWQNGGCRFITGIDGPDWEKMAKFADDAYDPGRFVAFRGFEYSTPTVGHINVWFGSDFTDPLHEGALATPAELAQIWRVFPALEPFTEAFEIAPDTASIIPFYEWLCSAPGSAPFGGGGDAIASFNHPGYFGNFEHFIYHGHAAKRIFLIEAFNAITFTQDQSDGHDATDYFWYGRDKKLPQPFNACFNAGWQVGFTGVSDEHSGTFGQTGKGRGGLYVHHLTRQGVRNAIMTKRSFGTREAGLRLDATANHVPMGSHVHHPHRHKPLKIRLDIARGPKWEGRKLYVQVIGPGKHDPTLLDVFPIHVPRPDQPVISFDVKPRGDWLFLRITDPKRKCDPLGVKPFEDSTYGGAVAYASPWFFRKT
jgi:hypothetical protein